jgi:8-oxo-dGTP pyrophosphatase MutT (NUDIX family)
MRRRNLPYRPEAPVVAELAAGMVVLAPGAGPHRVLLLHHAAEGRWCLPKGHVDDGESLATAAQREVREESGLRRVRRGPELLEVAYRFYRPGERRNVHKVSVYFLGRAVGYKVRLEPTFDRSDWVPFAEALRRVPFETDRAVLRAARARLRGPVRRFDRARPKRKG